MKTTSLLARATVTAAMSLLAVGCRTAAPDRFSRADANHDDQLGRTEISDYLATTVFESRDSNHDGKLTKAEWVTSGNRAQTKVFEQADTDHNGIVTLQEARASKRTRSVTDEVVRNADSNRNGFVSRQEMAAYYGRHE